MAEFFSFMKVFVVCGTMFFVATLVLMAMPQSKLRSAGVEMLKWAMVGGFLLLCASPLDFLPDPIYLDDIGYLIGAICSAKGALNERKRRKAFEDIEFEQTLAAKRGQSVSADAADVADDDERKEAA